MADDFDEGAIKDYDSDSTEAAMPSSNAAEVSVGALDADVDADVSMLQGSAADCQDLRYVLSSIAISVMRQQKGPQMNMQAWLRSLSKLVYAVLELYGCNAVMRRMHWALQCK